MILIERARQHNPDVAATRWWWRTSASASSDIEHFRAAWSSCLWAWTPTRSTWAAWALSPAWTLRAWWTLPPARPAWTWGTLWAWGGLWWWRRVYDLAGIVRKVIVPIRLSELCIAYLPGVVELQIALDMLGELQGLQCADCDLSWEVNLSLVVEHLAQQSLEFWADIQALQLHFYLSLV